MKKNSITIDSRTFLMNKTNREYIDGKNTWTGQRKSALLKLVFAILLLVSVIVANLISTAPSNVINFGQIFVYLIAPIIFLIILVIFFALKFLSISKLVLESKLILGDIKDFKIESGEWETIRITYEFQSPNGNKISEESKGSLSPTTYYEKKPKIGDNVIVQYLNDDYFEIL
jgi:hypothetical protein